VEQAKAKIQKLKTEPSKKSTMLVLSDDGFADSDPHGPAEFTDAELEPLEARCRKYWHSNGEQYNQWRRHLMQQYPYLTDQQITTAFLRSTKGEEVSEILRQTALAAGAGVLARNYVDDESEDGGDSSEEEEYTPVIKEEDIANLKALLPSFTDAELKTALVQANGNLELAADNLLRN